MSNVTSVIGYKWQRLGIVVCHECSKEEEWSPQGTTEATAITTEELKEIDDYCYVCDVDTKYWL